MKLRMIIGLAAIGGLVYLNKRRGGEFTLESFKRTVSELFGRAKAQVKELKDRTEAQVTHKVANSTAKATGPH
jgi:hypothetical protein